MTPQAQADLMLAADQRRRRALIPDRDWRRAMQFGEALDAIAGPAPVLPKLGEPE